MTDNSQIARTRPGLVVTVREKCRRCYTCVRECPAKAIRISQGQAEVIAERCVGCGNCVHVCSQGAKQVLDTLPDVRALLSGSATVAACIAPSFPAEFTDVGWKTLVGMIRSLGFAQVCEVAFGADLVARRYRELLREGGASRRYIATSCPALVTYVERHVPGLVGNLAPIVSPMVATARALRRLHGDRLKIVFIGPCIAKKGEARGSNGGGEVDAAITFIELRRLFEERGVTAETAVPSDFDPPRAGAGGLFAISRGLLQAAEIGEDLVAGEVVAAEGRTNFVEAIREFQTGDLDARLLEILCCNGCIMGAGMSAATPLFRRRARVSEYVRERLRDGGAARQAAEEFSGLDLACEYEPDDQRLTAPDEGEIRQILARMGKLASADELNCGACGYDSCREHAVAVLKGLAESEMCLPYTIEQLRTTIAQLGASNEQLVNAQAALMQSEKLASMGQLAAGVAHEVNNPLGVVLMYAHLLLDEFGGDPKIRDDLSMIAEQADRCKKIVAGLLHFSRQNRAVMEPVDLPELAARTVKALRLPESITVQLSGKMEDPVLEADPDQIAQVLTNLVSNAVAAMNDRGILGIQCLDDGPRVKMVVSDTGCGIPKENMGKIFEPFFTTKQIGRGTGLGLAITYGIVKMHYGDIRVESNADPGAGPTGTIFTVALPRKGQQP